MLSIFFISRCLGTVSKAAYDSYGVGDVFCGGIYGSVIVNCKTL